MKQQHIPVLNIGRVVGVNTAQCSHWAGFHNDGVTAAGVAGSTILQAAAMAGMVWELTRLSWAMLVSSLMAQSAS